MQRCVLLWVCILFVLNAYLCHAQSDTFDSLYAIRKLISEDKTKTDREKFDWLIAAHRFYLNNSKISLTSFLEDAEKLAAKNDTNWKADVYNEKGVAEFYLNNILSSQNFFYKSKVIFEKTKNLSGLIKSLNNLAGVCQEAGFYTKALEMVRQSSLISLQNNDSLSYARTMASLAFLHVKLLNFDSCILYATLCNKILDRIGEMELYYLPFDIIANAYYKRREYKKSISYCKRSIHYINRSKHYYKLPPPLVTIVNCYIETNQTDSALYYAKYLDSVVTKLNLTLIYGYMNKKSLAIVYHSKGQFDIALNFLSQADSLLHRYYEQYKFEKIDAIRKFYQSEDNEKQLTIKNLEIRETQNRLYWIYSVLGVVLLFGLVVFNHDRKQTSLNLKLKLLNEQLAKSFHDKATLASQYQSLNHNLEQLVDQRTKKLSHTIEALSELSFINAHKTRAGWARLQGLFYIYNLKLISTEELVSLSQISLSELETTIQDITEKLHRLKEQNDSGQQE